MRSLPLLATLSAAVLLACACAGPAKRQLRGAAPPGGPYSPGIDCGDLVFLAGQIGTDPATGQLASGGIAAETHQAMQNLGAVLAEAGLGYADVVKTSVFLADIGDFPVMNQIYASYFPEDAPHPVRTTVQVAAIPAGARIEVDFIAMRR